MSFFLLKIATVNEGFKIYIINLDLQDICNFKDFFFQVCFQGMYEENCMHG